MRIAILRDSVPGERRVALVPGNVPQLLKAGLQVVVETGAGARASIADERYIDKGAAIAASRAEALTADVILQVRCLGANPSCGVREALDLRAGQVLIGLCEPLGAAPAILEASQTKATIFALELIPRITRAQSMDVLSSMATVAGYRAVLMAALELPKLFPMLMTAAGTLTAARIFVIGAGVAGLQAIATARRLGGVVQAYDVRPASREQVESLGGKFVEMKLDAQNTEDKGGYAKAMGEEFYQKQRELMARVVAESDVVITTAAVPGKPSPRLITADAVRGMPAGSVLVDLAAERGGNCELTQADQRVIEHGVTILGPTNLPSDAPVHASQMFSNNVTKFLLNLVHDGQLTINLEDEIVRETLVAHNGEVVHSRLRELLSLPARGTTA